MMVIENNYEFGDIVYLITDPDQRPRIVTGILCNPGLIEYRLSCGTELSWQLECAISKERNTIIATTN